MQRIIYLSWPTREITGGIKMIFRHVETLRAAGGNAFVATADGCAPTWFDTTAPMLPLADLAASDDVLVFPENHQALLEEFAARPNRKVVFCQSYSQVFRGLGGRLDYTSYGVRHLLCPGRQVLAFCQRRLPGQDIHFVPNYVDRQMFQPQAVKRMQIAFPPRKRPQEAAFIQDLFRAENPTFRAVPWVALTNLSERALARTLGESALYLSLPRFEAFPLSPLEALASGCIVAGFTGFGGRDYTTAANGFWAAEDDCLDGATQLALAARLVVAGGNVYRAFREAAHYTVAAYSRERFQARLLACWRQLAPEALPRSPEADKVSGA
jgi:hypothetical protein